MFLAPITLQSQFCLDECLWGSDVGEAAATLGSYGQWRMMAGAAEYERIPEPDKDELRPRKRAKKTAERALDKKTRK